MSRFRRGLSRGMLVLALGLVLVSGLLGCGREPALGDTLVATSEVDAAEPASTNVTSPNDVAASTPDTPALIDTAEPTDIQAEALATATAAVPLQAAVPISRENRALVRQLTRIGKGRITDSDLSPDGRRLVVATAIGAYLYDVPTMTEVFYRETSSAVVSIAFSPDGRSFATGSDDGTLQLWDAASGELIVVQKHHSDAIDQLVFSPDGRMLASASKDLHIRVWNAIDGSLLSVREAYIGPFGQGMAFSPDGRALAYRAASYASETESWTHTIELWDPVEDKTLASLVFDNFHILAFSPGGQQLATGSAQSRDGTVQLWRVADGALLATLAGHTGNIRALAFSADGQRLISASGDGTARVWQATDGTSVATLDHPPVPYEGYSTEVNSVQRVAVSPDGNLLASGAVDGAIRLWNASDGALLGTLSGHLPQPNTLLEPPFKLEFLPDGKTLVSTGWDSTVRIWDVASNALVASLDDHTDAISCLAYSPDGRLLAAGVDGGTVRLINTEDNSLVTVLAVDSVNRIQALAFTPDGTMLVAAADDADDTGDVLVWRVGDWELLNAFDMYAGGGRALAISPDGRIVASTSLLDVFQLWNLATGAVLTTIEDITMTTTAAFSPDGRVLAIGKSYDEVISLWDVTTGAALTRLDGGGTEGHTDGVLSVAFSPDGQTLASGSFDHTVKFWAMDGDPYPTTLEGHAAPVASVAYTPNGQLLASGSWDGTVRLWNTFYTTVRPTVLEGHTLRITSLAVAPDGRTVASGSSDGTIRVWGIPAD